MEKVKTRDDVVRLLTIALKREWAVSFEYVIHAYSIPKGRYFYEDPVLRQRTDVRDQLRLQLALTREYVFTQEKLLGNARRIEGLA